jgi:hypothetical protein
MKVNNVIGRRSIEFQIRPKINDFTANATDEQRMAIVQYTQSLNTPTESPGAYADYNHCISSPLHSLLRSNLCYSSNTFLPDLDFPIIRFLTRVAQTMDGQPS